MVGLPESLQTLNDRYVAPAWHLTAPLAVTHGAGAYLSTEDGRRYLDFACGFTATTIGHCHPHVGKAAQAQTARLIHVSTTVTNAVMLRLAEHLARLNPAGLDMMFFHSSGAEVIEAAKPCFWPTPLIITAAEIDRFLEIFAGALDAVTA